MEVVARLGDIGNLHITVLMLSIKLVRRWENAWIFVAELQIPLHAAGRVLWTLAIITVRKRQNKT